MKKLLLPILLISLFAPTLTTALDNGGDIIAKSAYVLDLRTGRVLYEKAGEAQLPLASFTKLMTVYAAKRSGAVQQGVITNEDICFTLVTSSNEQAQQIAEKSFRSADKSFRSVEVLNSYAKKLGLAQTFYLNPTGLDISATLSGAYGSARDQAVLLRAFYNDFAFLLECSAKSEVEYDGKFWKNTSLKIENTIGLLGSKTGLTDLAGGNLAIVADAEINRPVIIIVMDSTEEDRFTDVENLLQLAMRNI